jgi:uncharacterized protein YqgV (UPF0045/DUF77 family)
MLVAFSVAPSGTPADGTVLDTAGSETAGSDTAGSDTAGSDTAGSDTAGSDTAGSDTAGRGDSVSAAVADAIRVVRESGLPNRTDAMFTTIEGEWDECMDVVKRACEAVGRHGSRVSLVLKADIRPGWTGELDAKVARVEAVLDR